MLIKFGFLTGNSYRTFSTVAQRAYVMGVIDGYLFAPAFGAPKPELTWLERCVVGMMDEQATAVVDKYMSENPVRWHEPMHGLVYAAMRKACRD